MRQDHQQDTVQAWMRHMRRGDWEAAWEISDAVLQSRAGKPCWHLPRHFQYLWDGTPPAGKRVLVRCYHGLGDTILFIRYAPLLKALAAEVLVWAQPPLLPLLKTVPGIDQVLPLHEGRPEVSCDLEVEIMELPHLFRTTPATIPAQIPYLQVAPVPLSAGTNQMAVGLVWQVSDWDSYRSIPFSLLAPLAQLPGIRLYILQSDARAAGWQEGVGLYPGELSLEAYAGFLRSLDLLIAVDTMAVHLAGALGVTVWTLLHAEANWRWMEDRDDSPWYPTMRLFRQASPGDWQGVIERVKTELQSQI
jgi:hypothetical protein